MTKPVLILDAFGVLYQPADDVAEYLVPFVRRRGGSTDEEYIKAEYHKASLGQMTSAEFWQRIGVQPDIEDDYLALIPLSVGVHPFMENIRPEVDSLWCLSNDISEWSRKLRVRHEISGYFNDFVISGDLGIRKPDPAIFNVLVSRIHRPPHDCIFVDDRVKNLDAAKALGFQTVLFGGHERSAAHPPVASFAHLTQRLIGTVR